MRWWPTYLAAATAIALVAFAACGGSESTPLPDAGIRAPESPPTVAAPAEEPLPGVEHTVGEQETLWDIARAYGVTVEEIMRANELRSRDVRRIRPGIVLRIPGAEAPVAVETAADRATAAAEPLPEIEGAAWHRLTEGQTLWEAPVEWWRRGRVASAGATGLGWYRRCARTS